MRQSRTRGPVNIASIPAPSRARLDNAPRLGRPAGVGPEMRRKLLEYGYNNFEYPNKRIIPDRDGFPAKQK